MRRRGLLGGHENAARVFSAQAKRPKIVIDLRSSGPNFAALCRVPDNLCMVTERNKNQGVYCTLAGGLITGRVIEEESAPGLVDG